MVRNVKLGQKRRGGELLNADSGKLAKTRNDPVKHAADQSRLQQAAASHLRHALLEDSASDLRKAIQKALSYKCFSEQGQTIRDARAILAELVLSSGTVSEDDEEDLVGGQPEGATEPVGLPSQLPSSPQPGFILGESIRKRKGL